MLSNCKLCVNTLISSGTALDFFFPLRNKTDLFTLICPFAIFFRHNIACERSTTWSL